MKKVAIAMGGYSGEANVSLQSGQTVFEHLDRSEFEPYKIHLFKEKWVLVEENGDEYPINRHDFSVQVKGELFKFDVVFNAIHNTPGEDGYLKAYLHMIGLPCTGCDFYQAVLTFNKRDCLSFLNVLGIKTAPSFYLDKGQNFSLETILQKTGLPCFIKPNRSGSSLGVSKVSEKEKLIFAIEKAFQEDEEILIESFLDGTEVSVGVIEYHGEVKVLPITEIISENEIFDYEAKYSGRSQEITPARLSPEINQKVKAVAEKIYHLLKMSGLSRAEYIIVDGEPYFLEINTFPGVTTESILPKQASQAGISMRELFGNELHTVLNKKQNLW
ncbi:MAG: D-alanine--D-alanine ligase [Flavobacteriales bacterium AspAUS03]